MVPWLTTNSSFPPLETALNEPNGLLAAGGDLSPQRLIVAYREGIFPWFNYGDPILWWSPDPRMVLFPSELKISRSLKKTLRKKHYRIRTDHHFHEVIRSCAAAPRQDQPGTWIHPEIITAYTTLHEMGLAHSVETWINDKLVGGLYGIALGKIFFGESMFSTITDASKIALVHLVKQLEYQGFGMIDCQMRTTHLASFGAREIPRWLFNQKLHQLTAYPEQARKWHFYDEATK